MSVFGLYLQIGIEHILDLKGYDHILFIVTLCAVYSLQEWRRLLILITAFTIGHSATLVFATLDFFSVNSGLIEFLIPLTIFFTAVVNLLHKKHELSRSIHRLKYLAAMFFGLIHGLGFSNYLRSLLSAESSIIKPLLAFNIGIEAGQLIIVSIVMIISWIAIGKLGWKRREWNLVLSGAALGISFLLMMERAGQISGTP